MAWSSALRRLQQRCIASCALLKQQTVSAPSSLIDSVRRRPCAGRPVGCDGCVACVLPCSLLQALHEQGALWQQQGQARPGPATVCGNNLPAGTQHLSSGPLFMWAAAALFSSIARCVSGQGGCAALLGDCAALTAVRPQPRLQQARQLVGAYPCIPPFPLAQRGVCMCVRLHSACAELLQKVAPRGVAGTGSSGRLLRGLQLVLRSALISDHAAAWLVVGVCLRWASECVGAGLCCAACAMHLQHNRQQHRPTAVGGAAVSRCDLGAGSGVLAL